MCEEVKLSPITKVAGTYTCPFCRNYLQNTAPDPNIIDAVDALYHCNYCSSKVAIKEVIQTISDQEPRQMIFFCYFGRPKSWADESHTDTCRTGEHGDPPFSRGQIVKANSVPIYPEGGGANCDAIYDEGLLTVEEVVHYHRGSYWVMRLRSQATNECFQSRFYPCEHFSLES